MSFSALGDIADWAEPVIPGRPIRYLIIRDFSVSLCQGWVFLGCINPDYTCELKSMRTAPAYLRKGVGAELLECIISYATSRSCKRLSLETGSGSSFEPAISLYRKRGFINGDVFGDYTKSEFNQFMHLPL